MREVWTSSPHCREKIFGESSLLGREKSSTCDLHAVQWDQDGVPSRVGVVDPLEGCRVLDWPKLLSFCGREALPAPFDGVG